MGQKCASPHNKGMRIGSSTSFAFARSNKVSCLEQSAVTRWFGAGCLYILAHCSPLPLPGLLKTPSTDAARKRQKRCPRIGHFKNREHYQNGSVRSCRSIFARPAHDFQNQYCLGLRPRSASGWAQAPIPRPRKSSRTFLDAPMGVGKPAS